MRSLIYKLMELSLRNPELTFRDEGDKIFAVINAPPAKQVPKYLELMVYSLIVAHPIISPRAADNSGEWKSLLRYCSLLCGGGNECLYLYFIYS